jgi:hypothetical protein
VVLPVVSLCAWLQVVVAEGDRDALSGTLRHYRRLGLSCTELPPPPHVRSPPYRPFRVSSLHGATATVFFFAIESRRCVQTAVGSGRRLLCALARRPVWPQDAFLVVLAAV